MLEDLEKIIFVELIRYRSVSDKFNELLKKPEDYYEFQLTIEDLEMRVKQSSIKILMDKFDDETKLNLIRSWPKSSMYTKIDIDIYDTDLSPNIKEIYDETMKYFLFLVRRWWKFVGNNEMTINTSKDLIKIIKIILMLKKF